MVEPTYIHILCIYMTQPHSHLTLSLSPTETRTFCPFSRISGVRKGRAKETAVAQAAQSAASEVGTRGLLFASSEGFSALMSAR